MAYGYRDFETLFTIEMALSTHAISRMTDTWRQLDVKARQQWEKINSLVNYKGNYKAYRSSKKKIFLSSKTPNILPYMGLYLKDLTALEEAGNLDKKGGPVNFHKMRILASIIGEIQQAQRSLFLFERNQEIITSLLSFGGMDEETLYQLSKKCEPSPESLPANFFKVGR